MISDDDNVGDNVFRGISLCVSVCLLIYTVTLECHDKISSFSARVLTFRIGQV